MCVLGARLFAVVVVVLAGNVARVGALRDYVWNVCVSLLDRVLCFLRIGELLIRFNWIRC